MVLKTKTWGWRTALSVLERLRVEGASGGEDAGPEDGV